MPKPVASNNITEFKHAARDDKVHVKGRGSTKKEKAERKRELRQMQDASKGGPATIFFEIVSKSFRKLFKDLENQLTGQLPKVQ